jgi:hypothetical protein
MSNKREILGGIALAGLGATGFGLAGMGPLAGILGGASAAGAGGAGAATTGLLGATIPESVAGSVIPMAGIPQMAAGGIPATIGEVGLSSGGFSPMLAAAPQMDAGYISGGGLMSGGMDGAGSDFTTMQRLGSKAAKFADSAFGQKLMANQAAGLLGGGQQQPQQMVSAPPQPMQQQPMQIGGSMTPDELRKRMYQPLGGYLGI